MFMIEIGLYAIVGSVAGFISGLLGIGGGIIVIPALLIIFDILGFPPYIMQTILATSLSAMIFNTSVALVAQQKRKNIPWVIAVKLIVGTLFGCIVGARIAYDMSSDLLKDVFGACMCIIGAYVYRQSHRVLRPEPKIPSTVALCFIGFANSTLSTLVGISGGLFLIPLLQELHFPLKRAIGIASSTNFVTAVLGSACFVFLYPSDNPLAPSFGPIYLPAFITIGIFAALLSPFGVKISHEVHSHKLQKIFAVVMFLAGLYMLLSNR